MALNEIVATVSLIIQLKAGAQLGTATGFFYTKNDKLFLVTNQHVVRDDKTNTVPDTLRLVLHVDENDVRKKANLDLQLYQGNQRRWKNHPKISDADVAVMEIDKKQIEGKFFVKAWSSATFLPQHYVISPGDDVFVMGFPLGFHDTAHNLPVFRNAMIASAYGVPFQDSQLFLTDANLHPGTSGSPVITKPKNTWVDDKGNVSMVTGTTYYLLGVHSGTYSITTAAGQQIPLGLGAAWYVSLVDDIAALF